MYTCDTELSCLVLIQRTSPTCRPFYIASFPRLDYIPCSSLTYFEHTNFIYLTIMLIYSVLTTIILPINENTIQYLQRLFLEARIRVDIWKISVLMLNYI